MRKRQEMHAWSKAERTSNDSGISMVKLKPQEKLPTESGRRTRRAESKRRMPKTQVYEQGHRQGR